MDIKKIFELLDLELDNSYQEYIEIWKEYYNGNVSNFHSYQEWNGHKNVTRERMTLGMAKRVCEDWASTLANPENKVTLDNKGSQELLDYLMKKLDVINVLNDRIDFGFGYGTSGIVTTKRSGKPSLSRVSADMMYPTPNGWLVISEYNNGVYYVSIHFREENGKHKVRNHVIETDKNELKLLSKAEVKAKYKIEEEVLHDEPMLHIIKPATANNVDQYSPYGISVFANALDELKGCDIGYTRMNKEIEAGKIMTFTTVQSLETLEGKPTFTSEEGYYVMEGDSTFADGTTVKVNSPTLRSEQIINTLGTNLNLLGRKVGFGDNAYSFNEGSIYTNTAQVISTNSKFYKQRERHLEGLRPVIVGLVRAILYLETGKQYKGNVTVEFDDSIIDDAEAKRRNAKEDLLLGAIDLVGYMVAVYGITEEQAIKQLEEQNKRAGVEELPEEEGGEE